MSGGGTITARRERIVVPQRVVNGGFDVKFETDPYHVKLYNIMTSTQYTDTILRLNDTLKPSRSKKVDSVLLATGVLMVPLAVWGIRHGWLTKKRKRLLHQFIQDFNLQNPTLHMRWNRRPESFLTIERKQADVQDMQQFPTTTTTTSPTVQATEVISDHQMVAYQPYQATNTQETPMVYAQPAPTQDANLLGMV